MASTGKRRARKKAERLEAMERAVRSAGEARMPFEPQGFYDQKSGLMFTEIEVADALRDLVEMMPGRQGG